MRIRRERPAGPLYVTVHGPGVTTPHPRILRADTADTADTAAPSDTTDARDTADAGTGPAARTSLPRCGWRRPIRRWTWPSAGGPWYGPGSAPPGSGAR
ncbi:hypothetical protein [Streptomyces sp. XY332]|uniref:hypothetical protein n=1 Tax=Streptomyces sp. XY332 TaxID=1415561 RepID=UPI001F38CFFB|nr:hypothetical protein [Streptomyces sp. XY332]